MGNPERRGRPTLNEMRVFRLWVNALEDAAASEAVTLRRAVMLAECQMMRNLHAKIVLRWPHLKVRWTAQKTAAPPPGKPALYGSGGLGEGKPKNG
jgi:hypothetical protein